jgi:hypothetical protein
MTGCGVHRVKAAFSSGCNSHQAILLQPEATGAVMEVTKCLKLRGSPFLFKRRINGIGLDIPYGANIRTSRMILLSDDIADDLFVQ